MTAKEYLEQYRRINAQIDAKISQVNRLRDKLRYVSGGSGGIRPTQPSDKLGDLTGSLVDMGREINEEICRLVNLRREIKARISALPDPVHRDVLEMRYISCWSVKKTAAKRNCSVETVYKNQREALKAFTDYYSFPVI